MKNVMMTIQGMGMAAILPVLLRICMLALEELALQEILALFVLWGSLPIQPKMLVLFNAEMGLNTRAKNEKITTQGVVMAVLQLE